MISKLSWNSSLGKDTSIISPTDGISNADQSLIHCQSKGGGREGGEGGTEGREGRIHTLKVSLPWIQRRGPSGGVCELNKIWSLEQDTCNQTIIKIKIKTRIISNEVVTWVGIPSAFPSNVTNSTPSFLPLFSTPLRQCS